MDDRSLDLVGVGRLAKAIPANAWKRLVDTACDTFEKFVAPITETTSGIGRLIRAKFSKLEESEKVIVAATAEDASRKAKASKKRNQTINYRIFQKVIENAGAQAEEGIRDLWSNLLAREMCEGAVHPEVVDALARLTTNDALLLLKIAKGEKGKSFLDVISILAANISKFGFAKTFSRRPITVNHVALERTGLIQCSDSVWRISPFGYAFLETVAPLNSEG